jgi:20S proteasome alpha/beta subunit
MTIIVGSSAFIAGDRRISNDAGDRQPPCNKIFRNKYMVVGVAGFYSAIAAMQHSMRKGACKPEDLIRDMGSHSQALCLWQGNLYDVSEGCVTRIRSPVYAIGTGAHAALGYLAGCGKINDATVRKAIRFTFTLRSDCGDGIRVVRPK